MKKRILNLALCIVLSVSCAVPTLAAEAPTEQESAAASLQAQGLMKGDENGDLHLDAPPDPRPDGRPGQPALH